MANIEKFFINNDNIRLEAEYFSSSILSYVPTIYYSLLTDLKERAKGFEPSTFSLATRHSKATELRPHKNDLRSLKPSRFTGQAELRPQFLLCKNRAIENRY